MSRFRAWVEVTCGWNHLQENGWLCTITISCPSNFTHPTRPNQPNELIAFPWFTHSCVTDPRCTWLGLAWETNASLPSSGHILLDVTTSAQGRLTRTWILGEDRYRREIRGTRLVHGVARLFTRETQTTDRPLLLTCKSVYIKWEQWLQINVITSDKPKWDNNVRTVIYMDSR